MSYGQKYVLGSEFIESSSGLGSGRQIDASGVQCVVLAAHLGEDVHWVVPCWSS